MDPAAYQGYYGGPPPPDGSYGGPQDSQVGYDYGGGGVQGIPPDVSLSGQDAKSYMQYTEKRGGQGIDEECGIAPRRLTDCVCLFIFLAYMIGMVILVNVCKNSMVGDHVYGLPQRLTHGMDFKARLCGIDPGVEDKPFLYWCRGTPWDAEGTLNPSTLDLENPTCVSECPVYNTSLASQIPCLFPGSTQSVTVEGGQFGNIETFYVQSQQNIALTVGYDTVPFGGRYCMPTDKTLKGQIMKVGGPLGPFVRARNAVGSFQDPWGVLFICTILAVVLGYAHIFLIKECGKWVIYTLLWISYACFLLGALFFAWGVVGLIGDASPGIETTMKFDTYRAINPFYERMPTWEASVASVVVSVILLCFSCGILGVFTHLGGPSGFHYIHDLIDAAAECFMAMRSMMIPPLLQALAKFIIMWVMAYNFMYLVSVAIIDKRRIEINNEFYKGINAQWYFDWWILPWWAYYIFGWVWLIEIVNSMGQFTISFSVISWYFMKKDGLRKTGVPQLPLWKATEAMLVYHLGSICFGAAVIPWFRIVRLLNWIEDESVPGKDAAFSEDCQLTSLGKCCDKIKKARKDDCMPNWCSTSPEPRSDWSAGLSYRLMKNSYNDVIIRSQHFWPASLRSFLLIHKFSSPKTYVLDGKGCQIVSFVGSTCIGIICSMFCYLILISTSDLMDPTSPTFIADPVAVCGLAFLLCGPGIGYGFMMLFDHASDTLLYCYAWNKKFNTDSDGAPVEDYMPESLRELIDDDYDQDDGYQYFGQARPEMYLSTWLPTRRKDLKAKKAADKDRSYTVSQSGRTGSAMYTNAPNYDTSPYQGGGVYGSYGGGGGYASPGGYGGGGSYSPGGPGYGYSANG